MARKTAPLPPQYHLLLHRLGERLRLLRMRQRLSAKQVAAAAGMSVMTLRSLERGGSGITMGAYLAVMGALGIERDIEALAAAAFTAAEPVAADDASPGEPARAATDPIARADETDRGPAPAVAPPATGAAAAVKTSGAAAAGRPADPAAPAAAEVSPQEAFEWLDAPALDLQRLIRPDRPPPATADAEATPAPDTTADLFGAPAAESGADGPREESAR